MSVPAWDDDWIDQCLRSGEAKVPAIGNFVQGRDCRWCTHLAHGLTCRTLDCNCDNSFNARDDSWRPRDSASSSVDMKRRQYADQFGTDGWVAQLLVLGVLGHRLKQLLQGQGQEGTRS